MQKETAVTVGFSRTGGVDVDAFDAAAMLNDADRALLARVRAFVDNDVLPCINDAWERGDFPYEKLLPGFRSLGIIGTSAKSHGAPALTRLQAGLVAMELSRGDGSVNTFNAVHSGLAIGTMDLLASEEQKERWMRPMVDLDLIGAFALTEPDHGSDSVALETTAELKGGEWVLNGRKRWIGLGHVADVVIVWARDVADGKVKAFVVEKDATGAYPRGYAAEPIQGKIAKRAIQQAAIELVDVRIPENNRLAKSSGFRDVSSVLNRTRTTVAWEALGHAIACYELAVEHAGRRVQFGEPIAARQLVQHQLAAMRGNLTAMLLMCIRTAQLQDEGTFSNEQASLLKMHVCDTSRTLCRDARDLLGGNGLLIENHVARHLTDMEVVHTYEGTHFIQALIVGRQITGIAAFQ